MQAPQILALFCVGSLIVFHGPSHFIIPVKRFWSSCSFSFFFLSQNVCVSWYPLERLSSYMDHTQLKESELKCTQKYIVGIFRRFIEVFCWHNNLIRVYSFTYRKPEIKVTEQGILNEQVGEYLFSERYIRNKCSYHCFYQHHFLLNTCVLPLGMGTSFWFIRWFVQLHWGEVGEEVCVH